LSNRSLLVVDMLMDFVDEKGSLYCGPDAQGIIPEVKREIEEARSQGEAVIYVCDRHSPQDPEFEMFPVHCVSGTPGAQVHPEIAPIPSEKIIPKRRFSGFYGTDLDLTLREMGTETVRVVGVCTNICVLYTVADARMRNYKVEVVQKAVASFDQQAHAMALREMEKTLGAVII